VIDSRIGSDPTQRRSLGLLLDGDDKLDIPTFLRKHPN